MVDYSRWDHIESSDEDEDVPPPAAPRQPEIDTHVDVNLAASVHAKQAEVIDARRQLEHMREQKARNGEAVKAMAGGPADPASKHWVLTGGPSFMKMSHTSVAGMLSADAGKISQAIKDLERDLERKSAELRRLQSQQPQVPPHA